MSVPGGVNLAMLASTAAAAGGYTIERSLRFNSADSAYLSKSFGSAGNQTTWTLSCWFKACRPGSDFRVTPLFSGSSPWGGISIYQDKIRFAAYSGSYIVNLHTTQVLRDPSAWYHLIAVFDSNNSTSGDRARLYLNGTRITTFDTATYPSSGATTTINSTGEQRIGHEVSNNVYSDQYLADLYFIDGQALDPTSFTEVDATTGQLIPKAYTGSFGTNGFKLDFADNSAATAAALGKDTSGNSNNWTPNNFSVLTGGPTSVAAATGGLPIYNTTGTYGDTKGSGTRTDSNSSSIVLAIPMDGTNNGTTFTDESATIKGSGSAKSITRNGDTKTVTAQSKYYGSSGYFDGTGDSLTLTSSDFGFSSGTAFTIECWFRASALASSGDGSGSAIFGNRGFVESNSFTVYLGSSSSNTIGVHVGGGAVTYFSRSGGLSLNTWYHLAMVRNTSNTVEFFVNGTSIGTGSPQGDLSNGAMYIAAWNGGSNFNGYIQDFRIYKGAAKYTSNFTPPDSTVNTSVAAGNDSLVDTPTSYGTDTGAGGEVRGNYPVMNPLAKGTNTVLSNGNLDVTGAAVDDFDSAFATIQIPATGKWYFEFTVSAHTAGYTAPVMGVATSLTSLTQNYFVGGNSNEFGWDATGSSWLNGTQTNRSLASAAGDVMQLAVDTTNGKIWAGRNNTWAASGDPSAGTNPLVSSSTFATALFFAISSYNTQGAGSVNFGQRPFAFPVSGFKALCDTNLPAPVVAKPNTVMDIILYTGNGSSRSLTGLNFNPDFIWQKPRSEVASHRIVDSVRGVDLVLKTNLTNAEATEDGVVDSFDSNGFTGGGTNAVTSGQTAVAWCWDAGSSTVTNNDGSISSQVRANASAGFSIVTWTGTGSLATIGHGLGVAPSFIVIKRRNASTDWDSYHASLGNTQGIALNSTAAASTGSGYWNNTSPTSTVFTVNTGVQASGGTYVAYCFAPVAGYSAFGSYTGNGSTDGPFVYTGFRPRWVMLKLSSAAGQNWLMVDSARGSYNIVGPYIYANSSVAEMNSGFIDLVSNGFKFKDYAGAETNSNGATYIYAAFAEHPFQTARAR